MPDNHEIIIKNGIVVDPVNQRHSQLDIDGDKGRIVNFDRNIDSTNIEKFHKTLDLGQKHSLHQTYIHSDFREAVHPTPALFQMIIKFKNAGAEVRILPAIRFITSLMKSFIREVSRCHCNQNGFGT